MKKIFLIITFLFLANICNSQFYIGTIKLKDSSGVLVVNGAIKTNESNATKQQWVKPSNLSSSVAGLGLSLSTTNGLIVNVGDGLQIVNDTLITDNSQLFNLDTTKLGYLSKPNIWTGRNQWTSSNTFYGITYFGTVETGNLTVAGKIISGNVDISGAYMINGVPITGGDAVDTSLLMHKNGGTQVVTTSTEFDVDVTISSLIAPQISSTIIDVSSGVINTDALLVQGTSDFQGLSTIQLLNVTKFYSTPVDLGGGTDINWNAGIKFYKTLNTATTFTFSNSTGGEDIDVTITNSGGSPVTLTWPTVSWINGTPPSQIGSNKTDIYHFEKTVTTIFGSYKQGMTP